MTPLDRLLAETIPVRPAPPPDRPRQTEIARYWTQAEQDAHWQALCEAVDTPGAARPHLRALPPAA